MDHFLFLMDHLNLISRDEMSSMQSQYRAIVGFIGIFIIYMTRD